MQADDKGLLAEIAISARTQHEYERGVLDLLERRIGFDVAMFKRATGFGVYTPGLDPAIARACLPFWAGFAGEIRPVVDVARQTGYVAQDVDVLGMQRMERLSFYQRLMQPHGGTSTALAFLSRRGTILATLALGRTGGRVFTARELDGLRVLTPTLSLCEASVVTAAPVPCEAARLTSREREVLAHLHLGHTNAQIALALGTAERTVRNQLSSIYEKLGVGTRAEAAAIAVASGLAAPSGGVRS